VRKSIPAVRASGRMRAAVYEIDIFGVVRSLSLIDLREYRESDAGL
jgi:hypothetical protein